MMALKLSPKKTFLLLCTLISVIIFAHFVSQSILHFTGAQPGTTLYELLRRFNLDGEIAIGSWYSSVALLVSSFLLLITGFVKKEGSEKYYFHWFSLASIFLYLSIDEMIAIHELSVEPVRSVTGIESGLLYFAWVIPALIIIGIVTLFFIKFFINLPKKTKILFALSFAIFIGGSVIVEMLSAQSYTSVSGNAIPGARLLSSVYLEEGMEMFGNALFIYALLDHLSYVYKNKTLQIKF
jgi:hypothetical protein